MAHDGAAGWAPGATRGSQPLNLADDFFLIAHDDVSGNPQLHEKALDLGLAAALIGEMMLTGWATIDGGMLTAIDARPPAPPDLNTSRRKRTDEVTLVRTVWDMVVREPWRHSIRTWLSVLGQDAARQVSGRLAAAGHLKVVSSRRRDVSRIVPTDWNLAGWPAARLRQALKQQHQLGWQDVVLLSLINATGLRSFLVLEGEQSTLAYLSQVLTELAERYPLAAELAAQTEAAVASAVAVRA